MKLNVKLDKIDDELMFKRIVVKGLEREIITPIKASFFGKPISHVNEIYKKFSLEKLDKCTSDENFERKTNREIQHLKTTGANFFIVDYSDLEIPKRKHIEALSDVQYENTDVVITPIFSKITRELKEQKLIDTFINLTNQYIETVEALNNRSILGLIPSRMPRQFLNRIVNNYHDKNITSFLVDFDGRSVDTNPSWIRKLMRLFKELDLIEESFLYSINANQGKFLKNATEIVAKDFISSGFGMDILGLNHIPPRMSSEAWAKIKEERRASTFRLFDRNSYGYVKKTDNDLKNLDIYNRTQLNGFNINEQYKESLTLQKKLKETNTIEPYIKTKSQVNDDLINKIKRLRKTTFQRSLSEY